jgi:mRNA interferase RelE/StbE
MNQPEYTITRISHAAERFIHRRDRIVQETIAQAFEYISTVSPFRHPNPTTIRQLRGKRQGQYRYRIGDIRIVYRVDRVRREIEVLEIDNRGDIY